MISLSERMEVCKTRQDTVTWVTLYWVRSRQEKERNTALGKEDARERITALGDKEAREREDLCTG